MNPFDWAGPDFLWFYIVFAAALLAWLVFTARREDTSGKPPAITDAYQIACLRGGPDEVLQVATFGLIERDALRVRDGEIFATDNQVKVTHPLDRAIVDAYRTNRSTALQSEPVRQLTNPYVDRLIEQGAWVTAEQAGRMLWTRGIVLALLLSVAGAKIAIALSRGRTNIQFLVGLAAAASTFTTLYRTHRRTRRGEDFLGGMTTMLAASQNAATSQELVMLAAVMGGIGLPTVARAYAAEIFPSWKPTWRERWSSMQGGSSDSTSSSSCSGGDGGGGGGCGSSGCGGCGGGE